jgi:hypothetical protein
MWFLDLFKKKKTQCELELLYAKHPFSFKRALYQIQEEANTRWVYDSNIIITCHDIKWTGSVFSNTDKLYKGKVSDCIVEYKQDMKDAGLFYVCYIPINKRVFMKFEHLVERVKIKVQEDYDKQLIKQKLVQ